MSAARGEDHVELGGLVGEVEERVLDGAWEMGEPAFFDDEGLLADLDLEAIRGDLQARRDRARERLAVLAKRPERGSAVGFGKRIGDGTSEAVSRLTDIGVGDSLEWLRFESISWERLAGQPCDAGPLCHRLSRHRAADATESSDHV